MTSKIISNWQGFYKDVGVSEVDIKILGGCFLGGMGKLNKLVKEHSLGSYDEVMDWRREGLDKAH